MLDSISRDFADEDACPIFQTQGREIAARLAWLKAGGEGALSEAGRIMSGLNVDHPEIGKLREHAVKVLKLKDKDLDAAIRTERIRQALGAFPRHPLEFIHLLAERRSYVVRADGTIVSPNGDEMLHRIMLAARVEADSLHLNYSAGSVNDATQQWFYAAKAARSGGIVAGVSEPLEDNEAVRVQAAFLDLCRVCFDAGETPPEFAAAVLMKFCHQVRRKMLGLPVGGHLMPVIVGRQGAGKSEICKRLLRPIEELTAVVDFKIVCDDRNIDLWSNYALFLDEMGRSTKADNETVRQCITADKLDRRPMHTNATVKVTQFATFIGTANAQVLGELIADTTGTRRFALLTFADKADWDAINAFDWLSLWRSIDPRGPDPILPVKALLEVRQEEARERPPVEVWVDSLMNFSRKNAVPSTELHGLFREWEERHSPRTATSLVVFGREMARMEKAGKLPFIRQGGKNRTTFQWCGSETVINIAEQRPAQARGHI